MKTTIEISDALLEEARRVAARDRTTVRSLVEEGLRTAIDRRVRRKAFSLRKASFKGRGLQAEIQAEDWEKIRELAYEGRGG